MKQLFLGLILLLISGSMFAGKVEYQDAKTVAINAYYQKVNLYAEGLNMNDIVISEDFEIKKNGMTVYYVFNFTNNGFIIISAEDGMVPVLGYSLDGTYHADNQPENFIGWMEGRAGAIEYIRNNNMEATPEIALKWNELTAFSPEDLQAPKDGKDVEPLLTCTWNQDWPYNYYCPLDDQGPGGRVYVGCVATAMSMIMYHWRYPEQGTGEHSYYKYPYGQLTVNFGETTYDWDGMVDNSDGPTNLPMALMGYHAGVAVDMDYGPDGSGAYSTDVDDALKDYFGYSNTCTYQGRGNTPFSTWKNLIQDQLDQEYPLYFSGQSGDGGHAFVLDGSHSDGTFHFNFGWSGYDNGWYDIADPAGYEWFYQQGMVKNFIPGDLAYPYGAPEDYTRTTLVGSFEDGSGPVDNYDPNVDGQWLISPQTDQDSVTKIELTFISFETGSGDIVTIYDGETTSDPVLGTFSGSVLPTEDVISTGNKMLVTFVGDGDAITGNGFKVEYSSIQPSWCSGLTQFEEPVGSFNDGSNEFYYKNGTNCMWKIAPPWASDVTLTFTEFHTEEDVDVVKIYDATNNQLLETLSGEYTAGNMPEVYGENGQLFLTFQSDGAMNYPGFTAEWTVGNVGVEEQNTQFSNLQVYPNPASNMLNVSFNMDQNQSFGIKLISTTGQVVYQENTSNFSGNYVNSIDLSGISKGVYFLNISNETGTVNKKVVVK